MQKTRLRENEQSHPGNIPATLTRNGLPAMKIALGAPASKLRHNKLVPLDDGEEIFPSVQTIYQQLHNYPVGASGGQRAATTFGNKYNITPVRREFLINLRAIIAIDANADMEQRIRDGMAGLAAEERYGLPFLGDNALLLDRVESIDELPPACWYERVSADQNAIRPRTTRLTIWIDRADMSKTKSALFAPGGPNDRIPAEAWTEIDPP